MNRYVAIGCSDNHNYSFFLPMVTLLWRRVGYVPVFTLNETRADWQGSRRGLPVLEALEELEAKLVFVGPVPGYLENTIAQSSRHYLASDATYWHDDLLIMSDADLLPIRKEFYYQHNPEKYPVGLYYSNAYLPEKDHFPTCHMSAPFRVWREVYEMDLGLSLSENMVRHFERAKLKEYPDNMEIWYFDQRYGSGRFAQSKYFPDQCQLIERQGCPPHDRIDRCRWPDSYDATQYTDCHALRPGWDEKNWPRLRPLFEQLLPERIGFLDAYRARFLEAMR